MKRVIVLLLIVAAGVAAWRFWPPPFGLFGASNAPATADGGAPRRGGRRGGGMANQAVPVVAGDVTRDDVPVFLEGVGTFQAPNTVTVRAQVEGTLVEVAFREGQDVKAGDVLARIDPATYQAQYDQSVAQKAQFEAQLANANRDYDRYQRLAKNDYGSQQQAETAKSTVAQLEAQVRYYGALIDQAKATLDRTVVRAPISGRTGVRGVDQGNYVTAGETTGIVTITQLQPISATFTLPQQNIQAVTRAMARGPVSVEALPADGGDPLDKGALEVIDNQVDQATGTVKLKASFPNAELALWPGQFTNIRVAVDVLKQVVVTPGPAIQQGPDGPFVYVVKADQTVEQRTVEVTRQGAERAVIASGVQPGDKVVITGFTRLRNGSKVAVGAPGATTEPEDDAPSAQATPRSERRAQGAGQ
ncbi:efflux RND transporter periplasmic adaptor subunit [Hansschlegelia quercus]|uniref:Efflux RND transporter periplasmic adaptor subunit n=1 Tax=Hansschlegelia quercus TaxID=2528245 RepID=A0A4Q9GRY5_9HYPH|nr:efflux RND transporter periplasmic adaptor subunit [Hansschlegelia quercus]TBN54537.1 efflux RND transporter periplasmic adaptor subunit [Hansschlegelia quercus]